MSVAGAALRSALGASFAFLEEAGVAEYVEETLAGVLVEGGGTEEIQEAVLPFLLDAGAVPGEEEGEAVCAALFQALSVGGSAKAAAPELKKLDAAVSMGKLVKADEAEAIAEHAVALKAQVNINADLGRACNPVNSLIEEDESEEAMKRRFKQEKRGAKRLKRELRREKQVGMQREEFMRELTREPVVLHWKGNSGSGPRDIQLKGAQMEIGGKQLLKDTDLTLVFGRKYGLVGRNGIGKTTFLKFLAAARFEGVPANLQILHIEQEVAGGAASVLGMVLATDVERSALLTEEAELLREQEEDEAEVAAIGGGKDAEDVLDEQERQARLLEIAERLEDIDARSAPARAGAILFG